MVKSYPVEPHRRSNQLPESVYNEGTAEIILRRLAEGEYLIDICDAPGMPSRRVVYEWRQKYPEFDEAFRIARGRMAEAHATRALKIALFDDHDGFNDRDAADRRLAVQTLQWSAARMDPGVYGDRTTIAGDASSPLVVETRKRETLASLSYEDRKRMQEILERAVARTIDGTAEPDDDDD